MVKIGSVTAEIFLILTNIARKNIAGTDVIVTVGICLRWSQNLPLNFGQIGSVTADIFLIWTNVARTNIAWINVILKVGICSGGSQEPTFKVWSKSDK